jgi:uncharacterized protein (TIGR03437 family)
MKTLAFSIFAACVLPFALYAQASPVICNLTSDPVAIRSQGLTERVSDIVITCTGGVPLITGAPIPAFNFSVTISGGNFSNALFSPPAPTNFIGSDAVITVNEPNLELQFPCTTTSGTCSNVQGVGLGPGPSQNKNVFQGFFSTPIPSSPNTIQFLGIPVNPPGTGQTYVLRITGLRVALPSVVGGTQINAFISVSGPTGLALNNNTVQLANVESGFAFQVRNAADTASVAPSFSLPFNLNPTIGPTTQPTFRLRFDAGFITAFKRRNNASTLADPLANTDNPNLGSLLNIEQSFSNNLFPASNGLNSFAQLTTSGTRLIANFTSLPSNVTIHVPTSLVFPNLANSAVRLFSNRALTDPAYATLPFPTSSITIAGGVNVIPLIPFNGTATATWEVVQGFDDIPSTPQISLPIVLSFTGTASSGVANVEGFLGPLSTLTGPSTSRTYPGFRSNAGVSAVAFTLAPPPMVTVNSGALPAGVVGTPYFAQLTAQGFGVITFQPAGPLPPGLTLTGAGTLTGTPTQAGLFSISVTAFDSNNTPGTGVFTVSISAPPEPPPPLLVTSASLPSGVVGTPYGPAQLSTSGGSGSVTYTVNGLPPGLTATSNGVISGTPTIDASVSLAVTARDTSGNSASANVGLNIRPRLTFSGSSDFTATQGRIFNSTLTATGGFSPYTFSLLSGSLPSGVTLASNGALTGTPTQVGIFNFNARATDVGGRTAERGFSLRVLPMDPANCLLTAAPTALEFTAQRSTGAQSRTVLISNNCGMPAAINATVQTRRGEGWLSFTGLPISIPAGANATMSITVTPGALANGSYAGSIQLTGSLNTSIPVSLAITSLSSSLRLAPTGLTFAAVANGPNPPPQTFNVITEPNGGIAWSATARTNSGGNWLSSGPNSGSTSTGNPGSSTVTVTVNSAGLAPGEYYGQVSVSAPNTASGQSDVLVVLYVLPPASPLSPTVSQSGFILVDTAPQELTIFNSSSAQITYDSSRFAPGFNRPWFTVLPPSGSIASGGSARVQLIGDNTGVPAGVQRGSLLLRFSDGSSTTISLAFLSSGPSAPRAANSFENSCTPTQLASVFLTIGPNFQFPVTFPRPLDLLVVDNCNQPVNQGQSILNFRDCCGNSTPMNFNGNGRYSATWVPFSSGTPNVEARTVSSDGRLSVTETVAGTIGTSGLPAAPPPVISTDKRVQNAASFQIEPLAQGSAISIFGENLASSTQALATPPFPAALLGTSVSLGGRLLPVTFVSDKQINAQLPYGIDPSVVSLGLFVSRSGRTSVEQRVQLTDSSPGAFTASTVLPNLGAILDESFQLVQPSNPARRDRFVAIYATGFGGVSQAVVEGTAAPSAPLANTLADTQVTVGGVSAQVLFSGLAPQNAGLYQINIRVPANAPTGNDVPVVIRVGGQQAPTVVMPVQ